MALEGIASAAHGYGVLIYDVGYMVMYILGLMMSPMCLLSLPPRSILNVAVLPYRD